MYWNEEIIHCYIVCVLFSKNWNSNGKSLYFDIGDYWIRVECVCVFFFGFIDTATTLASTLFNHLFSIIKNKFKLQQF